MKESIVLIGGGHGLSNIVSGFKDENVDLSVVVSSTDDGGHTGKIRDEFDSVAVGDLRMILNEFLKDGSSLKEIFNYRFDCLHGTNNVSLGNLVIASLWKKYMDIDEVIKYFIDKENINASIFLSSNNPLTLCAECEDGEIIKCERIIGLSNKKIKRLFVDNEAVCNKTMLEKIKNADKIILCPGSLYTSIGSVLCIDKIKSMIKENKGKLICVCNIMTQDGETKGYSIKDHVEALENIVERKIDSILVNNKEIEEEILDKYKFENSDIVICDNIDNRYIFGDFVEIKDNKVRHNSENVKKIILSQ